MQNLLLAYGISIAASAFGVLLGLRALFVDGVSHDTNFVSIMATTRNRMLDKLTLGSSLGGHPASKALLKEKLKFGVLQTDRGASGIPSAQDLRWRVGFGLEGQVTQLRKGQTVY